MAFHRQGPAEFEASARMYALHRPSLPLSALLLISNNGSVASATALRWLALYRNPPMLRMLVGTQVNMGYCCGELSAIAASVRIWSRFPWVLYSSGPDSFILPQGA
eukprot:3947045-Prymnesium_polylepis.1